jgi:hypothetical protein
MDNPYNIINNPLLTAIVGALIGFSINLLNERLKENKQSKKIRNLMKKEININITSLNQLCNKIWGNSSSDQETIVERLKKTPIKWNRKIWNNKSILFGLTLSESEIYEIEDFYTHLEKISHIKSDIRNMNLEKTIKEKLCIADKVEDWFFHDFYVKKLNEFKETVEKVNEKGNSIISKL